MIARKVVPALTVLLVLAAATAAGAKGGGGGGGGDRTPPTTPTNLRITATTSTSVSLAWNASSDNSGSFSYVVKESSGPSFTLSQSQTTFTRSRLWPQTTRSWFVFAVDGAGNRSGNSNSVSYTTPPDTTPPSPPPTVTATSVNPTRVSLTWTASVDNIGQVYYTLLVDGDPYFSDVIGLRSITVLDLTPATTYVFQVTARDTFGNVVPGNELAVTTPAATDVTAPTVPGNLHGFDQGSCEASLDWDQSTDDTDPQSAILYEIYVNGIIAPESTVIGYGSTIAYGRNPGNNTFVVRAVDTSGNRSGPSNTLTLNLSC